MLRVRAEPGEVQFEGSLPEGSTAFVDGDWIPDVGEATLKPLLWSAGRLERGDSSVQVPADVPAWMAAARALERVAAEALSYVRSVPRERLAISGNGLTARLAGAPGVPSVAPSKRAKRPLGWIEFTGKLDQIVAATSAVADLGIVVLAGEAEHDPGPYDFYPDAHARSLQIIGVAAVLADAPSTFSAVAAEPPSVAYLGRPVARNPWFEIRAT